MDVGEARALLDQEAARLRGLSYGELLATYKHACAETRQGASGGTYQLETEAFFDDKATRNLRVMISIDDGKGWTAFKPITTGFIIAPDGSFVGE